MPPPGVPVFAQRLWPAVPSRSDSGDDRRLVRAAGELRRHGGHRSAGRCLCGGFAAHGAADTRGLARESMIYSRSAEYAIRAVVQMAALPPGECAMVKNIAAEGGIPAHFLAKIL